jgi:3-oxoacyl-[acyl-carrier protein] reductase
VNRLSGKVAIVTDGSSPVGAAIAKAMAAEGAFVALSYSGEKVAIDRVISSIHRNGGSAVAIRAHLTLAREVERLFNTAVTTFGHVDIVVNQSEKFDHETVEHVTEADFHHQFNANVLAVFLSIKTAIAHFPASGGVIINVSAADWGQDTIGTSLSAATRAAVTSLTHPLSNELASRNIRVNAVTPIQGAGRATRADAFSVPESEMSAQASPWQGGAEASEGVTSTIVFLASDAAAGISGKVIATSTRVKYDAVDVDSPHFRSPSFPPAAGDVLKSAF